MTYAFIYKLAHQRGVSLVEVLVVLIILGLVSTLALSGGSNALLMKQKLQNAADKSFNDSLVNYWLRTTIESAYPLPEYPMAFDHAKLQFVTQKPLLGREKISLVTWSLAVQGKYVVLSYSEAGQDIMVRRWLDAEASFEFNFSDDKDIFPELIALEVNYFAPFGRRDEKVLVRYHGPTTYPVDYRRIDN